MPDVDDGYELNVVDLNSQNNLGRADVGFLNYPHANNAGNANLNQNTKRCS